MIKLKVSAVEESTRMSDCDGDTIVLFSYDGTSSESLKLNAEVNEGFAETSGSAVAMIMSLNALVTCASSYLKVLHNQGVTSAGPDESLSDVLFGDDDE